MSRSASWVVRQVDLGDRDLVRGLIEGARWRHEHLDWSNALSLLDTQPYLMAEESGLPVGCVACPPDPPGVAWIRVFASASGYLVKDVWSTLWENVVDMAGEFDITHAAALGLHPWMEPLLAGAGFTEDNAVLFLAWDGALPDRVPDEATELRDLAPQDIQAVAAVDHRAFQPIWRHSAHALQLALDQSSYARVALVNGEIAGYQISTATAFGAHLARLAVDPDAQHQGLGRTLVTDVLHTFSAHGYGRVTVNTQGDNLASQALYMHLGFQETGQVFPVFELDL
jgi:ribosomal protein S18 acetylase RimI-like enzyme